MKHRLFSVCIALATLALSARADAQRLIERGRFGVSAGATIFLPSAYQRALEAFGYSALAVGPSVSALATASLGSWWVLGGRAGFLHTQSTPREGSAIFYNVLDVSAVAGARIRTAPGRQSPRVELLAECGAVLGDASLNQSPQFIAAIRAAGSLFVGWDNLVERWYVGPRVTAAYVPWGGAGGSFFDPAFANITAAIEGGFL
ncbi:MAG: hypothetical protein U0269_17820 [Polyangiales bacterium]